MTQMQPSRQSRYRPGDQIGAWTLIAPTRIRAAWIVRCKCGSVRVKPPCEARAHPNGCSEHRQTRYRPGDKINDWTLVEHLGTVEGSSNWRVRCVCGAERLKTPSDARRTGCSACNSTYRYWTSATYDTPPPPPPDPSRIRFADITAAVSEHYAVSEKAIAGPRRLRRVAVPRMVVYGLARELTKLSTTDVGRRLGGRDHGTILHGVKRLRELRAANPELEAIYTALKARLSNRHVEIAEAAE